MVLVPPCPIDERSRLGELSALGLLDSSADPAFDRIARLTARVLGVPMALVSLIDADRQWFKARTGVDEAETPRDISFCGHAILGDELFVVEDATKDERFADNPLVTGDFGLRFYAGAPLTAPRGHRLGTLCVLDTTPRVLDATDRANLSDLARIVESEIANLALGVTDQLTGLHNLRGLHRALAHLLTLADGDETPVSVVYADLDGLKRTNDQLGHQAGDDLLRSTAELFEASFRDADVIARTGGDEFVVLLHGVDDAEVRRSVERFEEALASLERTRAGLPALAMSVGCTTYRPGETVASLLARADEKMYERKAQRRAAQPITSPPTPST